MLVTAFFNRAIEVGNDGSICTFGVDVPRTFARVEFVNSFVRKSNCLVEVGLPVFVKNESRTDIPALFAADKSRRVVAGVVAQKFSHKIFDVGSKREFVQNFGR